MTIGTKLQLLCGMGVGILISIAVLQYNLTQGTTRRLEARQAAQEQVEALRTLEQNLLQELKECSRLLGSGVPLEQAKVAVLRSRAGALAAMDRLVAATQRWDRLAGDVDRGHYEVRRTETIQRLIALSHAEIDRILQRKESGPPLTPREVDEDQLRLQQLIEVQSSRALADAIAEEKEEAVEAEALAMLYARRTQRLAIGPPLLGALGVLAVAWRIALPLRRSLTTLTLATGRVAGGDLNTVVSVGGNDELTLLARSFNVMLDGLRQRDRLAQQNVELESAKALLDRSNRELASFAQVVSHDLRAPLRAMSNYSRFLREDHAGELSEPAREYVQGIFESAHHMDELISGLLDYARIGRDNIEPEEIDSGALLDRIVGTLRLLDRADVTLPQDAPTVWARRVRLDQIFTNLLDNAAKFHRPGVRPAVTVEWADRGNAWEFGVRDNGVGIERENIPKLFRMFQRLRLDYEGTGMGLAIVKKAVEEHGGTIWVESVPGQGTVFRFTLPKPARA